MDVITRNTDVLARQGPTVIFPHEGMNVAAQLNYNFDNLALLSSAAAIMHYRTFCPRVDFVINLYGVRRADLLALANIWEHLEATEVHIVTSHGMPSDETRANIAVLLSILRNPRMRKKTMLISSAFVENKFAPLFEDVVFDRINVVCAGEVDGADVPRCRKLVPGDFEITFNIKETDALIQHVEKLTFDSFDYLPDGYSLFKPKTLDVTLRRGTLDLRTLDLTRLAAICRNVEKASISINDDLFADAAILIRRLRHVHTLHLVNLNRSSRFVDERLIAAMASLQCLRRLRCVRFSRYRWDFLGELPRLEKLWMHVSSKCDIDTKALALVPRLRSVTIDFGRGDCASLDERMRRDILSARDSWERPFLLLLHLTKLVLPPDLALFVCLMSKKDAPIAAYREVAKRPSDYNCIVNEWKDRVSCKRKHHARESDDMMDVS